MPAFGNPMSRSIRTALILACAGLTPGSLLAAPEDAAIVAAGQLAEVSNYSWICRISSRTTGVTSIIEGKTVRGGYTLLVDRNPSPFLLQEAGANVRGAVEAFFRGSVNCLILTQEGWRLPQELTGDRLAGVDLSSGTGGRGGRMGPANSGRRFGNSPDEVNFAIRHPHEDLDIIIGSFVTLDVNADTFMGDLTEGGAMQFLSSFGQPRANVVSAHASFQCWMANGLVVRYVVEVSGIVTFGEDPREREVNWTISTDLEDVEDTQLEVPELVKVVLG